MAEAPAPVTAPVTAQPAAEAPAKDQPAGDDQWKHEIFGCCDKGPAWCFCNMFCCATCKYGKAMEVGTGGNYCCCCLVGAAFPFNIIGRTQVLSKYKITESFGNTALFSLFCGPCSMLQIMSEVEDRERVKLGGGCCGDGITMQR
mmetsp:Transcript_6272/g.10183  ORF Transcript_6272/g.10183 Transcript_6272/m.10183 type:complete len:145 (-) Transcript_6272:428-862(-)|eukprot:CAMPEP_0194575980 /NCGR_PEP_ID=MMETSP0292-20121207/11256_1 /TAXON_ID=39354 /ORGANISM="Heterosigma akashiwo, Strain CCMP2393" /LENGTH=144 /DNA_ID=CAMNT_0039427893 /DNA_START=123 /DNA_END=557 /DNA_ORIENTATION=+